MSVDCQNCLPVNKLSQIARVLAERKTLKVKKCKKELGGSNTFAIIKIIRCGSLKMRVELFKKRHELRHMVCR